MPEEIAREAWAQIKAHLNDTGRVVDDAMLHSWFLDPAIMNPGHAGGRTTTSRCSSRIRDRGRGGRNRSPQIDNLFLAGEWVKTDQNVTTMEGANEGGRQAANGVLLASGYRGPMVKIVELFQAPWWVPFKAADRAPIPRRTAQCVGHRRHPLAGSLDESPIDASADYGKFARSTGPGLVACDATLARTRRIRR